ncbi:MAG: hypothetical protein ABIQ18_12735 [Umezawaea sp.]
MTTTEQIPVQDPAEQATTAKPPSNLRKGIIAAAVALAIAGGGGAVVYATSNTASSSSAIGQAPAGMGQAPNGGGDAFAGVAHGELQTGTVTAITSTSVTAESTDGYSKTYVIDAATVFAAAGGAPGAAAGTAADIAQGDTITVVASTSGDTTTAVQISETS